MKVRNYYNKNQFLIEGNGQRFYQSYRSICAEIDKNGRLWFGADWDYSNTTRKHLYLFLNDFKNTIEAEQYKNIFPKGFNGCPNKRKFLQNLIDLKIIKIKEF